MKSSKTRRILMLLGCAVLLVCLSVGATLAYLTSTTGIVTNTFTVGNVQITLDERDVDVYGVPVPSASPERVTENEYKLIPGHSYTKDPTIHVAAGSEKCYLFVKVVDEIKNIEAANTIADQMAAKGWKALPAIENVDVENVYYYTETVDALAAAQNIPVFDSFVLKGDAAVAGYVGKTITVQAYAVQADGFGSAAAAYEAAPCTWGEKAPATPEEGGAGA